ncbi:MAG: beta-ketoacyl synthase chain length factor [Hydrogenophaga sp.]
MNRHAAYVEGIAFWAPGLPDWAAAAPALCDAAPPASHEGARRIPVPQWLSAGERRRAPETVALALEAGRMALQASGRRPEDLPSVFVSAHGDLPIIDTLCATLASDALLLSPTKFLNSIHNAPAGLWSMAASSRAANTALTAHTHSFAAGALEALLQCATDAPAVLLVGCDTSSTGPLMQVTDSRGTLAVALVLSAERSAAASHRLDWALQSPPQSPPALCSGAAQALTHNGMADALPLFEALANPVACTLGLPLSAWQSLQLHIEPLQPPANDPPGCGPDVLANRTE